MNPRVKKIAADIERTKAKIIELQAVLPELERKLLDVENSEIIRLVRSADISIAEFPDFVKSLKSGKAVTKHTASATGKTTPAIEDNGDTALVPGAESDDDSDSALGALLDIEDIVSDEEEYDA
jgi:hypothetical protein